MKARLAWTKALSGDKPQAPPAKWKAARPHQALRPHQARRDADDTLTSVQVIRIRPTPKPRMSGKDRWEKRPCVLRYRAFCDEIRLKGARLPSAYHLTFIIPMPEGWSDAQKAEMAGTPHLRRPDASNLSKATEDALVSEDSVLWRTGADKLWGYDGAIIIRAVDPTIDPEVLAIAKQAPLGKTKAKDKNTCSS